MLLLKRRVLEWIPDTWEIIDLCNHTWALQAKIENKKLLSEVDKRVLMAG
jgi:hypothetical protein